MTKTVLVLGSTGRFGRHAAEAFEAAGWTVRRFARGGDVNLAAAGAEVIVNGWNPPYPQWAAEVPALTARVIAAARASGATVIVPGNVYPFGDGAPEVLSAETPHAAANPLGRVRAEMEASYRAAGIPVIVLRAGDLIDTRASGNWFDKVIIAGATKGRFTYPGDPDAVHAWAYLPDVARAAVMLAEARARLPRFADIPFAGYALSGRELAALVGVAVGREQRIGPFAWWMLRALSPVWPMARGLIEMRYLWSMPHRLSGVALARHLPEFTPTAPADAVASALGLDSHPDQPVARGAGDGFGHRIAGVGPENA